MITILGPTATKKTRLAACLAYRINAEIISADSRQVYRGMNIGTGKDYSDYIVEGKKIKYHLIDIVDAGYEYNVYEFQRDFLNAYNRITAKGKDVIMCGGSGLYLESVIDKYPLVKVPVNKKLRKELEKESLSDLISLLESKRELHNVTDIKDRRRLTRSLEIAKYYEEHPEKVDKDFPDIANIIFGIRMERKNIRERITKRLKIRLKEGMVEEVKKLLNNGLSPDKLSFYGLEYRYITDYLLGKLSYDEMFSKLNTAIHQYAKRQMTWFRRMERQGIKINWIDGEMALEDKLDIIISRL